MGIKIEPKRENLAGTISKAILVGGRLEPEMGRFEPAIEPVKAPEKKRLISLRLDESTIARFKATGPGWQTRINAALRTAKP
jgi:uncharacterized protein (DUF4415 family)